MAFKKYFDPKWSKLVFRPQSPTLRCFLRFDYCVGFNLCLWTKWVSLWKLKLVLDLWLHETFGPKFPKTNFWSPDPNFTSSNVNEVIRTVLNSLFFFLRKDFARTKSTKSTESTKPTKSTKAQPSKSTKSTKTKISEEVTFSLRCFLSE